MPRPRHFTHNIMKLCSACLLGVKCGYGAASRLHEETLELSRKEALIPICPEQLGGLPTPRMPSERKGKKVFMKSGKDVTENFKRGAEETLKIAKLLGIKEAVLKRKSPSCGFGLIHDGSFSGKLREGSGVTAELLSRNGIRVIPAG